MDYSDAAGTLLLDVAGKVWSETVLASLRFASNVLSAAY